MGLFDILDKCRAPANPATEPPSQELSSANCAEYQEELKLSYCLSTDHFRQQYGPPARVDTLIMSECQKRWPQQISGKKNAQKLPAQGEVHFLKWHHNVSTQAFTRRAASDHHYEHDESNLAILNYLQEHQAQHIFLEGITKEYRLADLPELLHRDQEFQTQTVRGIFLEEPKKASAESMPSVIEFQKLLLEDPGLAAVYLILHPDAVIHPVDAQDDLQKSNALAETYFKNAQDPIGAQLVFADVARRELEVEKRVAHFLAEHPGEKAFIVYGSAHNFADNFEQYPKIHYQEVNTDQPDKNNADHNASSVTLQTLASALKVWQSELGKKIHANEKPLWSKSESAYEAAYIKEIMPAPEKEHLDTPEVRYWESIRYLVKDILKKSYAGSIAAQAVKSHGYFDFTLQVDGLFGKVQKASLATNEQDPESLSHADAQQIFRQLSQEIHQHLYETPWLWEGGKAVSLKCRVYFTTDPDEARKLSSTHADEPFTEVIYTD